MLLAVNAYSQPKQFVCIEFTPTDAILEIDDVVQPTEAGVYQKLLQLGCYNYKLYKEGYSDISGIIILSDANDTQYLELKLKKQMGTISVSYDFPEGTDDAQVYIDDTHVGTLPLKEYELRSGTHKIRIQHPLYITYEDIIEIADEEATTLSPSLIENYINLTLTTSPTAYIAINGETKGKGTWSGIVPIGETLVFESKKVNHQSGKSELVLNTDHNNTTIQIPDPTPIFGSLVVTSIPPKSKVYIDGELIGITPKFIPEILIGNHAVRVNDETTIVHISEGTEESIEFPLQNIAFKVDDVVEEEVEEEAIPFQLVEEKPSFNGGDANEFSKWVNQRLVYPEIARENGVQGRVTLQFTVEKDGSVSMVKVLRGLAGSDYKEKLYAAQSKLRFATTPEERLKIQAEIDDLKGRAALDQEAVRVVSMSPKWTPGKQRNRAVPATYTFPVIFQLR